ncbi:hypothetical protein ACE7GA_25300 [Roseomonas sp. CCTCC AB2023176]|uniref:hypothetical protein n=1 Tax=Roseomonas sp. CCTCC AB2023176 TaxID=3342640 RepID=UPI0035DA4960
MRLAARLLAGCFVLGGVVGGLPAAAQSRDWPAERCARYAAATEQAFERIGRAGLGPDFLSAHETFLTSGCRTRAVCPRSAEELRMADALTVAAMNIGAASTFVPFACR